MGEGCMVEDEQVGEACAEEVDQEAEDPVGWSIGQSSFSKTRVGLPGDQVQA